MSDPEFSDLHSIRTAIDALDDDLVALLVERQHLVSRAADFKSNGAEVQAPDRAVAVVRRAEALADAHGGSGVLIGRIFTAMVAEFIAHEQRTFEAEAEAGGSVEA